MIPDLKGWNIVVIGYWNRMIFSPEWVGCEIFQKEEIEKLVPLNPVAPIIYRDDKVTLQIAEDRLVLNANLASDECLSYLECICIRIFDNLPKTPISAIGCNLGYTENEPSSELLQNFNFEGDPQISTLGWEIGKKTIKRKLIKEGKELNLDLNYLSPQITILANYHFQVSSAEMAKEKIQGNLIRYKEDLLSLLNEVYALQLLAEEA